MYSNKKEELRNELKNLCEEYMSILNKLKQENIISDETYNTCSSKKISFLEE